MQDLLNALPQRKRIPVYLLTGYLGSGKTSLLARWLKDGALARPALVINEVGEVGLDQHVLSGVAESAALIANTCICCAGLPGLEQALADLFRARLERKTEAFDSVIIETTGLADPLPIVALFGSDELLRERYWLAGVIAAIDARGGLQLMASHKEARSQVQAANLVVITKTDLATLADVAALQIAVAAVNAAAGIARSARASLDAAAMLALLAAHPLTVPARRDDDAAATGSTPPVPASDTAHDALHHGSHHGVSHHDADALFLPLPQRMKRQALRMQLDRWIGVHKPLLLRVKGLVLTTGGALVAVQWSLGDAEVDIAPFGPALADPGAMRPGLTVIVKKGFDAAAGPALLRAMEGGRE